METVKVHTFGSDLAKDRTRKKTKKFCIHFLLHVIIDNGNNRKFQHLNEP